MIGSSELVQTLVAHDLVDEFRVMIDPVVTEREDPPAVPAVRRESVCGAARWAWGLRAEGALSTMRSWKVPRDAEVIW